MKLAFAALLFLLSLSSAYVRGDDSSSETTTTDQPESAFLLVRRSLSEKMPKIGTPVTITVEIFNSGERAASNVKVQEPEWDEQLFRTEGDLEATFDSVPAGSTKSFKFMVTPKVKLQRFDQPSTEVTYEDNGKAVSTNGPTLYLQTFKAEDILLMKALNIGGYISLGMLTTGAQWARASIMCAGSFAVYVVINLVRKLKTMSQESKRKRALRELLKEE